VLAPVLFNTAANGQIHATDPDGDRLLYSVKAGSVPLRGSVSFATNGAFTYTPNTGETGADAFTLLVSDPFGASVEQTFNVTISAQAHTAPEAVNDTGFAVRAGSSLTFTPEQLLRNDNDADGDTLTLTAVSNASGGTVAVAGSGAILFRADAGFSGQAQFDYTVTDASGASDTATVFVSVEPTSTETGSRLIGTNQRDTLTGGSDADYFRGKDGNDVIIGGAGNDTFSIIGDDGRDRIIAGSGFDVLMGSAGNDVFHVTSGFANLSGLERIDGRGGHDTLRATFRNDRLDLNSIDIRSIELIDLGAGNDWVRSSARNESFVGGPGQDTFQMTRTSGHDVIRDFTMPGIFPRTADRLDLRAWEFDDLLDLQAHSRQSGKDVIISFDADTSVTLKNMHVSSLALLDILF
jgi:Ca2+-binding RTX toxin-like protein